MRNFSSGDVRCDLGGQCQLCLGPRRRDVGRVQHGLLRHDHADLSVQRHHQPGLLVRNDRLVQPYARTKRRRWEGQRSVAPLLTFARHTRAETVITCPAGSYDYASWPAFSPLGVNQYVNGTCDSGYTAANGAASPQRLCLATGAYTSTERNACIRTNPTQTTSGLALLSLTVRGRVVV